MVQMLNMKISKIAAVVEEQDQDKNYGPVGLTTGGSNFLTDTIALLTHVWPINPVSNLWGMNNGPNVCKWRSWDSPRKPDSCCWT